MCRRTHDRSERNYTRHDGKHLPKSEAEEVHSETKSKESFQKASANLSAALINSDRLLRELSGDKKKKFEAQLGGFKSQVKDLNARLEKIIGGVDKHTLPKVEEIHQLLSLAIAGTGFGMDVSKENAAEKTTR